MPRARGQRWRQPGELAIAAQRRRHLLARFGEGRRVGDHKVEALAGLGEPGGFAEDFGAAKGARCRRRRSAPPPRPPAPAPARSGRCRRLRWRRRAPPAPRTRRCSNKDREPAPPAPGRRQSADYRAGRKTSRSFARRADRSENRRRFRGPAPARRGRPGATRASGGSPSCARAGLSLRSTIACGRNSRGQSVEHQRLEPGDAGGVRLHDQNRAETVDDQTRQPVGLGMDEPVIGLIEQALAQPQGPFEPAQQKSAGRSAAPASRSRRRPASRQCGLNIATPSGLSSARRRVTSAPGVSARAASSIRTSFA